MMHDGLETKTSPIQPHDIEAWDTLVQNKLRVAAIKVLPVILGANYLFVSFCFVMRKGKRERRKKRRKPVRHCVSIIQERLRSFARTCPKGEKFSALISIAFSSLVEDISSVSSAFLTCVALTPSPPPTTPTPTVLAFLYEARRA